jgi:hypothetical protein
LLKNLATACAVEASELTFVHCKGLLAGTMTIDRIGFTPPQRVLRAAERASVVGAAVADTDDA